MRALIAAAALVLASCGDNIKTTPPTDGPAIDAPPGATASCVDRPTDLLRPPTGALPCELLPPGLVLEAS